MPAPIADAATAAEDTTATAAGQSTADDATDDQDDSAEEKDWKAEYEAQQRINRSLERKTRADLKRIQALEAATSRPGADGKPADAPDPEKIRAEIEAEITSKHNARHVADEAKLALFGKVNISPAAALRLLDLSEVEVDKDGNVDTEALGDLVAKLLTDEPHLAVAQGTGARFQGSADQGPRGTSKTEAQGLNDQLAEATKAGRWQEVIGLKQRIAALAATKP